MNIVDFDETIEDLQCSGLRLIQKENAHRFGEDSVLLANFVSSFFASKNKTLRVFDLGCGAGVISMLLAAKLPYSVITGVDNSSEAISVFSRNIILNGLSARIDALLYDWKEISAGTTKEKADIVVSNPPYFTFGSGTVTSKTGRINARSADPGEEGALASAAAYLLKSGGTAFFIYRSIKFVELISSLRENELEPVRLRFIHPFKDSRAKSFLISARKSGKPGGMIIESPLVIFDSIGVYSDEVIDFYGKSVSMSKEELYRDVVLNGRRDQDQ